MAFEIENLPDEWKVLCVRDVSEVITGRTPSTKRMDFYGGEYNLISPVDLDNGKYVTTAHKRLTKIGFNECRALPKDTILIGCIGNVGKLGMVSNERSATNQQINAVICNQENDPHFLYYSFYANRSRLEKLADKTTVPILNKTNFENFEIAIPPLDEQRKIAGVLGVVQEAIELQEQLIQKTTELKKTLLHQLFTHGLHNEPQKQTEIGPMPESWKVVKLAEVVEQIDYGISAPIPKTPPENGVKIVSTADITKDGRLLYSKIRRIKAPEKTIKRLTLRTGDVLFNWRNSAELIGKSAVFTEQIEPHVFASFILRIVCGEKKSHNYYLSNLMNYFRETEVFVKLARRAVNQANYNRNEISVLKIPLPPYTEQVEIAETISVLDGKIENHRQKNERLTNLLGTLLHHLVTAQIRVNGLEIGDIDG